MMTIQIGSRSTKAVEYGAGAKKLLQSQLDRKLLVVDSGRPLFVGLWTGQDIEKAKGPYSGSCKGIHKAGLAR